MTQKERSARCYRRRRENGLCPRCGTVIDGDTFYCADCAEKVSGYRKESRIRMRELRLCTTCQKVKVFGEERQCIECREKYNLKRKPLTDEKRKERNEKFAKYSRSLYQQRVEDGICTRCGKRKPAPGKRKCQICLNKDAEIKRLKYIPKGNKREEWKALGLCYYCGAEIDTNTKLCSTCLAKVKDRKGDNPFWRADNKLIFQRR